MALLLCILLAGSFAVSIGGRNPSILYLDFALPLWLAYEIYFRGFLPDFRDRVVCYLATGWLLLCLVSALFNPVDVGKSIAAIKGYVVGFLFFGISRRKRPSLLILSIFGGAIGVSLLYGYYR